MHPVVAQPQAALGLSLRRAAHPRQVRLAPVQPGQRSGEVQVLARAARQPFRKIEAARNAIRVELDVHVPHRCGRGGKGLGRRDFPQLAGLRRLHEHRQHDPAVLRDGPGEDFVAGRVGAIRFGEQDVDRDALHTRLRQALEQRRVDRAAPGPAPHLVEALLVDRDNDDIVRRALVPQHQRRVVERLVEPPEPAEPGRQRGQRRNCDHRADPFNEEGAKLLPGHAEA